MNIDKILSSPLINRSALSKLMYPNNKSHKQYLYNKQHNVQRQSITFKDRELIKKIIADLFADINTV